jgi:SAM-dependent methyltransferase
MNSIPWAWADNSIDEINMQECLEHVKVDPLLIIMECYRILKPGGTIRFTVPHVKGTYAYMPDHRWQFSVYWFMDLCKPNFCRAHSAPLFTCLSLRLNVLMGRRTILDAVASRMPLFWERFLPAPDQIDFTGRKEEGT